MGLLGTNQGIVGTRLKIVQQRGCPVQSVPPRPGLGCEEGLLWFQEVHMQVGPCLSLSAQLWVSVHLPKLIGPGQGSSVGLWGQRQGIRGSLGSGPPAQ